MSAFSQERGELKVRWGRLHTSILPARTHPIVVAAFNSLIRSRLAAAQEAGCTIASITARPQNVSARNTERAGFSLAYTKATFVKRYLQLSAISGGAAT